MRILYVEDNEVNQALIERVVRAKSYSIVFREEGEEALEVLAEDSAIDLILLDIELAGVISGLEVIRTLRARNDHRPVVAITAYAMMGDRERILNAGCDQYLPKPLVITDLLNLLEHYEESLAARAHIPAKAAVEPATAPAPAAEAPQEAADVAADAAADVPAEAAESAQKTAAEPTPAAIPAAPATPSGDGKTEPTAKVQAGDSDTHSAPADAQTESADAEPVKAEASTSEQDAVPAVPTTGQATKNGTPEVMSDSQKAPTEPPAKPASPVEQDEFAKDSLV